MFFIACWFCCEGQNIMILPSHVLPDWHEKSYYFTVSNFNPVILCIHYWHGYCLSTKIVGKLELCLHKWKRLIHFQDTIVHLWYFITTSIWVSLFFIHLICENYFYYFARNCQKCMLPQHRCSKYEDNAFMLKYFCLLLQNTDCAEIVYHVSLLTNTYSTKNFSRAI